MQYWDEQTVDSDSSQPAILPDPPIRGAHHHSHHANHRPGRHNHLQTDPVSEEEDGSIGR